MSHNYSLPCSTVLLARMRRDDWMELARRARKFGNHHAVPAYVKRARLHSANLVRALRDARLYRERIAKES